jgi:eukaryotic-like serine/threonine-protein kinase
MADLVGQQLGNYHIIRLLGQGAFAEVYLGRHVLLETQAAIKVLHGKLTHDEREGFLDEAHILSRLAHSHIVRVLDFAVEDGSPFLVMEYAPNGTLRQRHPDTTPVPLDTIVSYVKQVASALQYAHDEKLIHRDVKPENMLGGKHHEVLLSDFGFVTVSLSSRVENVQDIAGTMAYMAPEQIQARPSRASDQYALGIVIYEWLCGQRPFTGTLEEIAAQHMSIAPPSLRERIPTLSPGVEMVVMRALEKDPSRRFARVQEFAEAFERACMLGPEATKLRESLAQNIPSKAKIVNPNITEPKAPTPIAIPQQNVGFRAVMPQQNVVVNRFSPISSSFQSYSVSALALSPDGKRVAFGGWDEAVYVFDVAEGGKVFTYRGHAGRVLRLAWSPDGESIASASKDKTVQVWDATTGGNVFTYRGHSESIRSFAWSPDSLRIASGIGDKTVQLWDATTGNTLFTYRGHSPYSVGTLAWSPDGKRIASGSLDGKVQVWNTSTGSIICTYRGHFDWVKAVAWSPDGAYIASAGGSDKTVQVWNANTRSHIFTTRYHSHPREVIIVGWSVDGKRIRVGYEDGSIQELDATTGNNVFNYHTHPLSERFVSAITWTPDGTSIAIGSGDRKVVVYDTVEDNSFVCRGPTAPIEVSGTLPIVVDQYAVKSITWSPDGKHIASSASNDHTVQVWDATTGNHVFAWNGLKSPIRAVAWSPDNTRIASISSDGLAHVWDSTTGNIICSYHGHSSIMNAVAWSPDGKCIASPSFGDGTVHIWDTSTGDTILTCSSGGPRMLDSFAWSPDGKRLVSGSGEGSIQVWDATNGNIICSYRGHTDWVTTVAWSPDGTYFASGSDDTTVQVWDATSAKSVFTYQGHSDKVVDVAWSPDGNRIYSSSQDNTVQTWDATTGGDVFVHRGHTKYLRKVTATAWKADGTYFAIGSKDSWLLICDAVKDTIIVCNIPSDPVEVVGMTNHEQRGSSVRQSLSIKEWGMGNDVVIYTDHRSTVRSIAWSPDSRRIVSGGYDSTVHLWDAAFGTLMFTYREHLDPVVTVAWSPDGRHIASGSLDNTIHLWEVVTGRNILIYRGHANCVWSVTWSPDSKRIASASEDGTVQIWDVNTGKNVFTYRSHSAPVQTVAWSPNGKYIASGGDDRTVRVWNASTGNDIYIYRIYNDSVLAVAWSPDSKRIASGGDNKEYLGRDDRQTVQIRDAMNGDNVVICNGSTIRTYAVTWSPDGKYIASNADVMVPVWNTATGDPVNRYLDRFEPAEILHVSWSPDGTRLAASDKNGKIRIGSVDLPGVPR